MKADDRRRMILDVAIDEYGRTGMHATSTELIAERAGVSQPYIFRLFGTKTGLICAAIEHHTSALMESFRAAVEHRGDDLSPMQAMGLAYLEMLTDDANSLRCQLHTWAAASDPEIREVSQRTYREIWELVAELSDAEATRVRDFMATGMLLTVLASLDQLELFGDPSDALKEF